MDDSREMHDDQNWLVPKWTPEETNLLIASVREQPELYDPKNSKYKLLKFTDNLWTNFDLLLKKPMGACKGFYNVYSLQKIFHLVISGKDRWGYLRSTFRKEYMEKNNISKWKYYKPMLFLKKFLYSRGPTLNECIQKALRGQTPKNQTNEELDNDNEGDPENPMITVMSLPDGARNRPEDKENEPDNVSIIQRESSFTAEYHYDEAEQEPNSPSPCPTPDYTFAIPKLEPIEVDDQLQHMSTPIVPPAKRLRGIKRSSPTIMQIGNVKIQKLSTTPSGNSHHYTVMRNDQEKVKSTVNCTKIERLNVSTTDTQLIANNSSMMKPHNFTACSCKADADTMFMQSLLPDIKKLRSEERMAFKVKVHQMLQDALYKSNKWLSS